MQWKFHVDRDHRPYGRALTELAREQNLISQASPSDLIDCLKNIAEAQRRSGNLAKAHAIYDHAFRISVRIQHWQVASWCLWGKAVCTRGCGQTKRTLNLFASARNLARVADDRRCVAWASAQIAEVHRILGFRDDALRQHLEILNEFRSIRDLKGISWALNGIGQIYRVEGERDKAKDAFHNGAEIALQDDDVIGEGWALRGLAEHALHEGDLQRAATFQSQARANFEAKGYHVGLGYTMRTASAIETAVGNFQRALEILDAGERQFIECSEVRGLAYLNLTRATVFKKAGFLSQAMVNAERAAALFRQASVSRPAARASRLAQST